MPNNLPAKVSIPDWSARTDAMSKAQREIRMQQYEALAQGLEAPGGIQPSAENMRRAKAGLAHRNAARGTSLAVMLGASSSGAGKFVSKGLKMALLAPQLKWPLALCMIACLYSGREGPIQHVTSILGSAAKVTEAASLVVDSGADLTTTTIRSMVSITTGTLNLAETAWHGVDLLGLDAKQVRGRVSADSESVLSAWLLSEAGLNATGLNAAPDCLHQWQQHLRAISVSMPFQRYSSEHLNINGSFLRTEVSFALLHTGFIMFDFAIIDLKFSPRWSNPVWESLQLSHDTEREQIAQQVGNFIGQLPVMNVSGFTIDAELAAPVRLREVLRRHFRAWYLTCFRWIYYFVEDLRGVGCLGLLLATLSMIIQRIPWQTYLELIQKRLSETLSFLAAKVEGWDFIPRAS